MVFSLHNSKSSKRRTGEKMIVFSTFFLVGFHQRSALPDEGSTQNVGPLEEIRRSTWSLILPIF